MYYAVFLFESKLIRLQCFSTLFCDCNNSGDGCYLCPLVVLCIVGLHSAQIRLAIVSTHSVKPVTQQANTHCIPGNTKRGHSGPRVRLWVIPAITILRLFIHIGRCDETGGNLSSNQPDSPGGKHWDIPLLIGCNHWLLIGHCWQCLSAQTENRFEIQM